MSSRFPSERYRALLEFYEAAVSLLIWRCNPTLKQVMNTHPQFMDARWFKAIGIDLNAYAKRISHPSFVCAARPVQRAWLQYVTALAYRDPQTDARVDVAPGQPLPHGMQLVGLRLRRSFAAMVFLWPSLKRAMWNMHTKIGSGARWGDSPFWRRIDDPGAFGAFYTTCGCTPKRLLAGLQRRVGNMKMDIDRLSRAARSGTTKRSARGRRAVWRKVLHCDDKTHEIRVEGERQVLKLRLRLYRIAACLARKAGASMATSHVQRVADCRQPDLARWASNSISDLNRAFSNHGLGRRFANISERKQMRFNDDGFEVHFLTE